MAMKKYERRTLFVKLIKQIREIQADVKINRVAAQGQVAFLQQKISRLLDTLELYADLRHQYQAYAQALDKTQREKPFMVDLIREHQILRDRFERRGLDPEILDCIDQLIIYRTTNL